MAHLLAPGSNKAKIKADLARKKKHFKLALYASLALNVLLLIKLFY